MAIHEIEAPDGKIHEIEAPEDASPEQIMSFFEANYKPESSAPEPSLIDQFNQPLTDVANKTGEILQNKEGQSLPSVALQVAGQGANLAQLPATIAMQPIVPLAHATANLIDSTDVGQSIGDKLLAAKEALSPVTGAISDAAAAHPEIAKDIGAATNVAGTLIGGQKVATPATNELGKGIENIGGKLESSAAASSDAKKAAFAEDLYAPKLTPNEIKERAGNTTTKGINQTPVYTPPAYDAAAINTLKELPIKKTNTLQANLNVVDNAIGAEADGLKTFLDATPVKYKPSYFSTELDNSLTQLKTDPLIVGDGEVVANRIFDKMKEIAAQNPKTPSGLLKTRQEFDAWARSKKGSVFDANDTAFSTAVKMARNTANDTIATIVPHANVKASLLKQSQLIGAADNMLTKIPTAPKTRLGMVGKKLTSLTPKSVGGKLGELGAIGALGAAGLATGTLPAIATTAGATGLGYGAYKAATSPALRKGAGKVLSGVGKAMYAEGGSVKSTTNKNLEDFYRAKSSRK